jgi:hypothetical protein
LEGIIRRSRQQTASGVQLTTASVRVDIVGLLGAGGGERLIVSVILLQSEAETETEGDGDDGEADGSELEGFLADHGWVCIETIGWVVLLLGDDRLMRIVQLML